MPFTHIVMFRWKKDTTPAQVDAVTAALTELTGRLGVTDYRCGPDAGLSPGAHDYAIVGGFPSREDFLAYRDHPDHQRILAELIVPHLDERTVVQLES